MHLHGAVAARHQRFQADAGASIDGSRSWSEPAPLWPHLTERYSIFGSVSRAPDGDLFYFGTQYPIDTPGEPNWSDGRRG